MLQVLYIDDDETNRDIVKRILARAPYDVTMSEAEDGHVGVAMAGEKHPELILMDFHMPGLAGPDAIKQIRANETLKGVKIIALTADIYSRGDFEDAGCDTYLTKPIRKNALLHAIGELFPNLPKE
jgi:CheY-like chemotaxis protein